MMILKMKYVATLMACLRLICGSAVAIELVPSEKKPVVFATEAGAFAGKSEVKNIHLPVSGAKIFKNSVDAGGELELIIKARATDANTKAAEITLRCHSGKTWGFTFPLDEEWREIRQPLKKLKYFSHWRGMPPLAPGEWFDPRKLEGVNLSFGKWLCRGGLDKPHGFEVASISIEPARARRRRAPNGPWDATLDDFPQLPGETDDTARIRRAIDGNPSGVVYFPAGTYSVSSTVTVKNRCSLMMHKCATLVATREMPCIIAFDGTAIAGFMPGDFKCYLTGGRFDGNGLASCVRIDGFVHFTIRDSTILNGRVYGLEVNGGCEIIAEDLYLRCVKRGLAGNTGVRINGGDSHYTDCIVVDYTVGFNVVSGGANRLTRCHVWGGPLPPARPGELPEMLKDSVSFKIEDAGSTILRDCFADTGKIGYLVNGWDTKLLGCSYFNNYAYGLDDVTVIKHTRGRLYVADGQISKDCPKLKVYRGNGQVVWSNMTYTRFGKDDERPGAIRYPK